MPNKEPTAESIHPGMLYCGRYRIEEHLATGGMATVYRASDTDSNDEQVAIKVLFGRYSDNDVVRARFLDEGRIQSMLDHPNIVGVQRIISEPVLSFVMEYIDGETLEDYLQREAPLDERDILDLFMPVMSAVGFAHSKGIVHRDLKPSNVLLREAGGYLEPKVMDFGVAKVSHGKDRTADGTTVGTLHYMSPEQIVGARDIDGRADIYSLGCSLYKLCTGDVPFNASTEFALMMAQVEAPPTPPSDIRDDISEMLEQIILRALAKEPEHRFQTIKEMTSRLMELGDNSGQRDTITRQIPAQLLQYALEADEVVRDQTDEIRLAPTTTDQHPQIGADDIDEAARTLELSSSAIREIETDRLRAQRRKSGETRSLPQVDAAAQSTADADETVEQMAVDRVEELRRTDRQSLDNLKTRPDGGIDDASLPTTTERPRPDVDDSTETLEQPTPQPDGDLSDSGQRGVVAVDNPDVDSREITGLLDKSTLESGPTDEFDPSPSLSDTSATLSAKSEQQRAAEDSSPEITHRRPPEHTKQTDPSVDTLRDVESPEASPTPEETGIPTIVWIGGILLVISAIAAIVFIT